MIKQHNIYITVQVSPASYTVAVYERGRLARLVQGHDHEDVIEDALDGLRGTILSSQTNDVRSEVCQTLHRHGHAIGLYKICPFLYDYRGACELDRSGNAHLTMPSESVSSL